MILLTFFLNLSLYGSYLYFARSFLEYWIHNYLYDYVLRSRQSETK